MTYTRQDSNRKVHWVLEASCAHHHKDSRSYKYWLRSRSIRRTRLMMHETVDDDDDMPRFRFFPVGKRHTSQSASGSSACLEAQLNSLAPCTGGCKAQILFDVEHARHAWVVKTLLRQILHRCCLCPRYPAMHFKGTHTCFLARKRGEYGDVHAAPGWCC